MTVTLITTIQVFQGNTADVKPDVAPAGSIYTELDGDQREWTMDKFGWVLDPVQRVMNISDYEAASLNQGRDIINLLRKIVSN